MTEEDEFLVQELEAHMLKLLRSNGTQKSAIEWMKKAYVLLETCAAGLKKPKIYSVPGTFGVNTFTVVAPRSLILPVTQNAEHIIWSQGKTIVYGEKYQDRHIPRPFTRKDVRKLEQSRNKK